MRLSRARPNSAADPETSWPMKEIDDPHRISRVRDPVRALPRGDSACWMIDGRPDAERAM
ncbi:MAG TPA: hypothetical protein VF933_18885 [Streptosporangiaceae bacterium]